MAASVTPIAGQNVPWRPYFGSATLFDQYILPFRVSDLSQSLAESKHSIHVIIGEPSCRTPIIGIVCCARAASGHATAAPPKSVMNSRRCMVRS
jgi:hypothetical protein